MEVLFLIGRILYGGFFLLMAKDHLLTKRKMLSRYATSKNVPAPGMAVVGTGLLLLLGGLSLLLGYQPLIGIAALVVFFLGVTLTMHDYWNVDDPQTRAGQKTNFLKNIALLGAALMLLIIENWPLGLG